VVRDVHTDPLLQQSRNDEMLVSWPFSSPSRIQNQTTSTRPFGSKREPNGAEPSRSDLANDIRLQKGATMNLLVLFVALVASLLASGIEAYVFAIAYPGFALVGEREFSAIHTLHSERITFLIGPALLLAFGANVLLAFDRPVQIPVGLAFAAALAGGIVLVYTALVAVPLHARLGAGMDAEAIAALNATEWIRALATFAQAACDVTMLWLVARAATAA
jgi:hypothetical protein